MRGAGGGAYPRVCGGTVGKTHYVDIDTGLSPRMRGNRTATLVFPLLTGPIPAYAGEPHGHRLGGRRAGAYPRVCGGTGVRLVRYLPYSGLSPRMRGNHSVVRQPYEESGPIPAYAGEPQPQDVHRPFDWAYPRVCGGTMDTASDRAQSRGLSPRMRGNRCSRHRDDKRPGPIPAYAGEPYPELCIAPGCGAYPRVCGGTQRVNHGAALGHGLSPRMRGNPDAQNASRAELGPIPAYAGEPPPDSLRQTHDRAYPRVCGGTFFL